jgi:hypothetical protein
MRVTSGFSANTFYGERCTPDAARDAPDNAGDTPGQPDRTSAHAGGIPGSVRRTSGHAGCTSDITGDTSDEAESTPDIVRGAPDGKRCAPDDASGTSGDAGDVSSDDRCMEINELCRFSPKASKMAFLPASKVAKSRSDAVEISQLRSGWGHIRNLCSS